MLIGLLFLCPAKGRHMSDQVVLLDERVGPYRLEKLVFLDNAIPVLDEEKQNLKCLTGHLQEYAVHPDKTSDGVD